MNYNFKINFNHYDDNNDFISHVVVLSDILLFYNDMLIINDLDHIYVNQWDLCEIKDLRIELVKK